MTTGKPVPPPPGSPTPASGANRNSAVALGYRDSDSAPRVVAKGYGVLADTILRTARDHGLYVHESPELVGLLMQVDMDSRIPPALYQAIAELLAWLYRLDTNGVEAAGSASPHLPSIPSASSERT